MGNLAVENLGSGQAKNSTEVIVGFRDRKAEALYNKLCKARPWH